MHFVEFKLKSRHLYSVLQETWELGFQNGVAAYENSIEIRMHHG